MLPETETLTFGSWTFTKPSFFEANIYMQIQGTPRPVGKLLEIHNQPEQQRVLSQIFFRGRQRKPMHCEEIGMSLDLGRLQKSIQRFLEPLREDISSGRSRNLHWIPREEHETQWLDAQPVERFREKKLAVVLPDLREESHELLIGRFRHVPEEGVSPHPGSPREADLVLDGAVIGRVTAEFRENGMLFNAEIGGHTHAGIGPQRDLWKLLHKMEMRIEEICGFHADGYQTPNVFAGETFRKIQKT